MAYKYQPIKDEIFVSDTEDGDEEGGDDEEEQVQDEFEEVNLNLVLTDISGTKVQSMKKTEQ